MHFNLTESQKILRETIEKLLAGEYSFEQRRAHLERTEGFSRQFWKMLAEQGMLALPFPEEAGGLGGGAIEQLLVAQAIGRALLLEPYLPCIACMATLLRHAASTEQAARLIPNMISGDLLLTLAAEEADHRFEYLPVKTLLQAGAAGLRLNGQKVRVPYGGSADLLVVLAREEAAREDDAGLALVLVDVNKAGVARTTYKNHDGLPAAHISFVDVEVREEDRLQSCPTLDALEAVRDTGIATSVAEATGAMEAALHLTVTYLKQRSQFGQVIGKFQALQHRCAEMLVSLEQARSMSIYAALALQEPDVTLRRNALSAAKYETGIAARHLGQLAIQLHGGLGVSEEYAVGHYFRRLTLLDMQFGDAAYHLDRYVVASAARLTSVN